MGHIQTLVTAYSCVVVVPYFLSAKEYVVMQAMFKWLVFKDSDQSKILTHITLWYGVFCTNSFPTKYYYSFKLFTVKPNQQGY